MWKISRITDSELFDLYTEKRCFLFIYFSRVERILTILWGGGARTLVETRSGSSFVNSGFNEARRNVLASIVYFSAHGNGLKTKTAITAVSVTVSTATIVHFFFLFLVYACQHPLKHPPVYSFPNP